MFLFLNGIPGHKAKLYLGKTGRVQMCHLIAALQGAGVQRKAAGHARAYGLWPAGRLQYVAPVRRFNGLHSGFV